MVKKREPFLEGRLFEEYAWPTIRRNFPRRDGWVRLEQLRLPSGLTPDYVLWNGHTDQAIVIEVKDRARITEPDVRKIMTYMAEVADLTEAGDVKGFVTVALDTQVENRVRRLARRNEITIRRLWWRR